jgi:hypothetical protein
MLQNALTKYFGLVLVLIVLMLLLLRRRGAHPAYVQGSNSSCSVQPQSAYAPGADPRRVHVSSRLAAEEGCELTALY